MYSPIVNSSPALHHPFLMLGMNSLRQKPQSSRRDRTLAIVGTTEPYSVNMLEGRNEYTAKASSAAARTTLRGFLYFASLRVAYKSTAGASARIEKATSFMKPRTKIFSHSKAVNPMTVGGTKISITLVSKPKAAENKMNMGAKFQNQSRTFCVLPSSIMKFLSMSRNE